MASMVKAYNLLVSYIKQIVMLIGFVVRDSTISQLALLCRNMKATGIALELVGLQTEEFAQCRKKTMHRTFSEQARTVKQIK